MVGLAVLMKSDWCGQELRHEWWWFMLPVQVTLINQALDNRGSRSLRENWK